ncbi:hypothetical protein [Pseudogracilibacillus auburnensis]|uniref:hypothetical protein n=1 Tax=Pseudogracilibacillus auburnensis TaxID=1494959 RepID=UPI001F60CF1F|nr:hypothetical protein [Pseudogracilibacillus auburnensis]
MRSARRLRESVPEEERRTVSGMITDLEYAISWMKTGRMPGNIKSIEKKNVYQNNFWDSSIGVFVCKSAYMDLFEEVEKRIDAEMEEKRLAKTS